MNAAIWSACVAAESRGWRVVGVREGFRGLLEGLTAELDSAELLRYGRLGGTLLGTARLEGFAGLTKQLRDGLRRCGAESLLVLGGNGSLAGAALLAEGGMPVIGAPATIDNDVADSDESIGFDTAVNSALMLLDGMRDSGESLPRAFSLETLGGDTGFIAAAVAEAGAADALLVPEEPVDEELLARRVGAVIRSGRAAMLVASEGVVDLEGILVRLAEHIETRVRHSRIGHAQRGGRPTARDRTLATRIGLRAIEELAIGSSGRLVSVNGTIRLLPFEGARSKPWTRPGSHE